MNNKPAAYLTCSTVSLCLFSLLFAGCSSTPTSPQAEPAIDAKLSNGYSLLYELVSKEKDVDKLLWIKSAPAGLTELVKKIAKASSDARETISGFAKTDPRLALDRMDLPPMEKATRAAIESSTSRRLLLTSDHFATLLTQKQIEAAEYGLHLAQVIAEAEPDAQRKEWLKRFGDDYRDLRDQFIVFLAGQEATSN